MLRLSPNHYGIRSNFSTEKATFKLLNDIRHIWVIFFAFDCISHDLLIKKLTFYGIVGNAHALIRSCHTDRYQQVLIDDDLAYSYTSSEWEKINHGMPQGSILGPMLFLFYINDLPKVVNDNTEPVIFSDDTSIIVSNSNLVEFKNNLISAFQQLNAWFIINLLSLNYNKTQFIQFTTTNNQTTQLDVKL
jgi:hypothetical protein